jgi:hypothetical protein
MAIVGIPSNSSSSRHLQRSPNDFGGQDVGQFKIHVLLSWPPESPCPPRRWPPCRGIKQLLPRQPTSRQSALPALGASPAPRRTLGTAGRREKEEQGNEKRKKNEPLALEKGSDKPRGAHSVGLISVKGAVWQLAKQLITPQLASQVFLLILEHSGC